MLAVAAALESASYGVRDCQRRFRLHGDTTVQMPGFAFTRDDEQIEVFVFPERAMHQPPLSAVDRRPMRRATRGAVLRLLDA